MKKTIEKKFFAFFVTYSLDLARKWYVCYYTPDYFTGKLKKHKYSGEINKYLTVAERLNEIDVIKNLIEKNEPLPDCRGARKLHPKEIKRNFASTIKLMYDALDERKKRIDAVSYSDYKGKIINLENWLISKKMNDLPIGKFTTEIATDFLNYLIDSGYANATFNSYKTIFGTLFQDIIKRLKNVPLCNVWREIDSLPKNTKPYKIYTTELEKLTALELRNFDEQLYLFVHLTHFGFIRGKENRFLKVSAFDFEQKSITVESSISKNKKTKTVTIPEPLYKVLIDLKINEAAKDLYLFSATGQPDYKPVSSNHFANKWRQFRLLHNIPDEYKLYAWKHTGMIKSIRAGSEVKEIQLQAAHHSLDQVNQYLTTMDASSLDNFRQNFPDIGEVPVKKDTEITTLLKQILGKLE